MIENKDLTGGAYQEAGFFEEIMRTMNSFLQREYDSGRIQGSEYASAYIASSNSALQTASQFILSKDLVNQQILLAQEQVTGQTKQNELIDAQIAKMEADTLIATKQLDLITEQIALTVQQTAKVTQDALHVAKQIEIGTKQLSVMDAQIANTEAQTSMVEEQEVNVIAEGANIAKQGLKLDAEVAILVERKFTEQAQTKDTVDGSDIAGMLGAQVALYRKQIDGYDRDAEQKAAKIYADFYSVTQSVVGDIPPEDYGANGSSCTPVFDKLKAGIDVT